MDTDVDTERDTDAATPSADVAACLERVRAHPGELRDSIAGVEEACRVDIEGSC